MARELSFSVFPPTPLNECQQCTYKNLNQEKKKGILATACILLYVHLQCTHGTVRTLIAIVIGGLKFVGLAKIHKGEHCKE